MTRATDLARLQDARDDVIRLLTGASAERLRRKPAPDRWSPLEIFEHLVLAERSVLRGLPDPAGMEILRGVPRSAARRALVAGALALGIPVRVPADEMRPAGNADFDGLKSRWAENEEWIRRFLAGSDPGRRTRPLFRHPVAGALTLGEALRLDRIHVRRHTRRLRTLLSD